MKPKIALFHFFLKKDGKGGAEKMFLDIKEHFGMDFWTGGIDLGGWGQDLVKTDIFASRLWNSKGKVFYLHKESKIPIWRLIKRQLNFLFSSKIKQLRKYDIVIFNFTGIFFVPQRLGKKVYKIGYCNTPPRVFTDQLSKVKENYPIIIRPVIDIFASTVMFFWKKSFEAVDLKIANSENIKNRILKYTGVEVDKVIWPPVDVDNFKFIGQKDYYISYARLEDAKRIRLVVEAFAKMPDKKLIICSSGPLKDWLINEIKVKKLNNIVYKGIVSNDTLYELVGNCIAGIYLPKDEDAGMTQCEIMAAGKPVIGVAEGGLLETIVDEKHGVLLKSNPALDDVIQAVQAMTVEKSLTFRKNCEKQAQQFSKQAFLQKIEQIIQERPKN